LVEARARLDDVRGRIAAACLKAQRPAEQVRLVAVSKTVPAERVRELIGCGQSLFGENRVQEARLKIPQVGPGALWHLVGTLQRNKARHAVGLFELIHSVDSIELAREIDRRAATTGRAQAVLLQLELAGEATKSGVIEQGFWPLLDAAAGLSHLELRGLMTVPPPVERAEASRGLFARLRELRDLGAQHLGCPLPELSMGMTDDFEVAVEEGATLVRVGRALFGERA
jgi:PLP dependent protein